MLKRRIVASTHAVAAPLETQMQHRFRVLLCLISLMSVIGGCSFGLAPKPEPSTGRLDGLTYSRDEMTPLESNRLALEAPATAKPRPPDADKSGAISARPVAIEKDVPLERRIVIY